MCEMLFTEKEKAGLLARHYNSPSEILDVAVAAVIARLAAGVSVETKKLNYPGDEAAVRWSKLPFQYCSCAGRGEDDNHKVGCKFWEMIMEARKMWHNAHISAWSCQAEARGEKQCTAWCGHQKHCPAAMKVNPDSTFTLAQLQTAVAAARVQALNEAADAVYKTEIGCAGERAIRALIGETK